MQQVELHILVAKALARWAALHEYRTALPPSWLGSLQEMVSVYYGRLVEAGKFELAAFEEDVYKLVCCFAVGFLRDHFSKAS